VSPDEDSESVCSSQDACSVLSEEGVPVDEGTIEEDMEFHLGELIDQLGDKKLVFALLV